MCPFNKLSSLPNPEEVGVEEGRVEDKLANREAKGENKCSRRSRPRLFHSLNRILGVIKQEYLFQSIVGRMGYADTAVATVFSQHQTIRERQHYRIEWEEARMTTVTPGG